VHVIRHYITFSMCCNLKWFHDKTLFLLNLWIAQQTKYDYCSFFAMMYFPLVYYAVFGLAYFLLASCLMMWTSGKHLFVGFHGYFRCWIRSMSVVKLSTLFWPIKRCCVCPGLLMLLFCWRSTSDVCISECGNYCCFVLCKFVINVDTIIAAMLLRYNVVI